MTSDRSWTHRAAMLFYEWIVARGDEELPQPEDICFAMEPNTTDPYRLGLAIAWLEKQKMIEVWRGTRGKHGRHMMIRVTKTGRVYRTAGCPFELPQERAA